MPFYIVLTAPFTNKDGLLHTAKAEQLPPGEGGIDISVNLNVRPKDIPASVEVPMEQMTREQGAEAVSARVWQATKRFLGQEQNWVSAEQGNILRLFINSDYYQKSMDTNKDRYSDDNRRFRKLEHFA